MLIQGKFHSIISHPQIQDTPMVFNSSQAFQNPPQLRGTMSTVSKCHSLFIFLCQLTSANICWELFRCPLWERSILPSFSPAATAPNLKDAGHPWGGPWAPLTAVAGQLVCPALFRNKLNSTRCSLCHGWVYFSSGIYLLWHALEFIGRDFPRSRVSLLPWENCVSTLSAAVQTLTN